MAREKEVTILNIDENDFMNRLLNHGAVKKDEFLQEDIHMILIQYFLINGLDLERMAKKQL